jgi:hypothetical protein
LLVVVVEVKLELVVEVRVVTEPLRELLVAGQAHSLH